MARQRPKARTESDSTQPQLVSSNVHVDAPNPSDAPNDLASQPPDDQHEDIGITLSSGSDTEAAGHSDKDRYHHKSKADDDGDPVLREYDVFFNDSVTEKLQLMLLQYPNRDRRLPYLEANRAKPTELRMKPRAGLIEVDIPMETFDNYDQEKAVRFGDALRISTDSRAGGSLGLAGGFGIGITPSSRTSTSANRGSKPEEGEINSNRLLNKQTLGGQMDVVEAEKPIYMLGAFHKDQLHLTPVNSITQLRPQFHHIDAMVEQERSALRTHREAVNPPRAQETQAIQMTAKSVDGEDITTDETRTALKAAQEESWRRLDYIDETNSEAWTAYDRLFVQDAIEAPELQSGMTNKEFLDAISSASSMTTTTAADHITAKKSSASKSDKPTAPVVEASGEVKVDPPTKKKKKAAGRPA